MNCTKEELLKNMTISCGCEHGDCCDSSPGARYVTSCGKEYRFVVVPVDAMHCSGKEAEGWKEYKKD